MVLTAPGAVATNLKKGVAASRETIRAQRGYHSIERLMNRRQFDLMILDEANMAVTWGLRLLVQLI